MLFIRPLFIRLHVMNMQFNTCLIVPKRAKKDAVMSSRRIMSGIYYTRREKLYLKNPSTRATKKMM